MTGHDLFLMSTDRMTAQTYRTGDVMYVRMRVWLSVYISVHQCVKLGAFEFSQCVYMWVYLKDFFSCLTVHFFVCNCVWSVVGLSGAYDCVSMYVCVWSAYILMRVCSL